MAEAGSGGNMRSSKWLMFVMLLTAVGTTTAFAATFRNASWTYQNGGYDRDDDRYSQNNRAAYQDGMRQGRYDAEHRLSSRPYESRWRGNDDRRAYSSGYIRAYRDVQDYRDHGRDWDRDHDRDRDHDADHDRDRDHVGDRDRVPVTNGYGQGSNYYRNMAKQTGYQDGQKDGTHDKQSGHSFRPTQMDNYKSADRGFRDDMGDINSYKLAYREGYSSGYKNGWDTNTRR
jgi:hypothetical protein